MQLDLRTVAIKPIRNTFTHVAKYIGNDKPASRYQEATYGMQSTINFHYRPIWAPEYEIFDASRTRVVMSDWYKLLDPRQYYYGSYTLARARMQEAAEADFSLVEDRNLAFAIPEDIRSVAQAVFVPLRHVEWGGNTNNMFMAAYGYGAAFTTPATFCAMDHLGMAQYLTRLGLILGDPESLDDAKAAWLHAPTWQGVRKYVEDCFVVQDWFELFVAQNIVLDGLLYPLVYEDIENALAARGGGAVLTMLTRFQSDWFAETERWNNAVTKIAAAESAENKALIEDWVDHYAGLASAALEPVAALVFGAEAGTVLAERREALAAKLGKLGLAVRAVS
jgi:phenol/toluene 2-monooxygenase (NADH) P1/A1